ncbi:SMP-30/gluconolactonase/LRE family protein [Paraburkholderia caballeronis]|uniref:Sugar lactone lactonase YvrE n=1 Tax=Paraburkholderia caballeronis TaxID=416943 RepID=A0A1H7FVJ1_9BURK|nr:SMP-30/gluconolactonase/LRE family protein [Paraburkholderia caballeronis]PXW24908.1 gluconolactonase [Paraburkholderia caballeronis]PXX00638.1 gluconolactonase [Paraburkholderia caballeronis]RAJ98701.1 gluconolactonase [Paraburkholderia caballeronis]SEE70478.1 gluconolactonase [Paraburkholderia caballeronis]SEK27395.1 Sugar lactone lactonase YvrE [Paraburkholderia caballeronis]
MNGVGSMRAERVAAAGDAPAEVGECPVWRAAEGALYWVDIVANRLNRLHLDSGRRTAWRLPERIACFAFDRDGALLAGMESGLFAVDLRAAPHGGEVAARRIAAPAFPLADMRFNDGRCDRQGRFWAGTMVQDTAAAQAVGSLFRYDAKGGLSLPVVDGLIVQNGLSWSPDGRTMYLSDSHASRRLVWVYDYDVDAGWPRNRRLFADLHAHVGRPDGAAVDADGGYWICANDAGRVLRFAPDGRLDRQIELPAAKPAMCAFGGRDLDTLFITTIRPAANATEHDGHLFAARPGVCGLPEPEFAGALDGLGR